MFAVSMSDPKDPYEDVTVYDALETALLTRAYRKSTRRLTSGEAARIVGRTRWQHWGVASPTFGVTEAGLMDWGEDGCLHLTDEGARAVEDFLLDPADSY